MGKTSPLVGHLPVPEARLAGDFFMCEFCELNKKKLDHANGHISSLLDALTIGSNSQYEVSEPYIIGGPPDKYEVIAPYLYDCEWKVDAVSAGASASQILVSSSAKETTSMPDFTGASGVSYSGLSPLDGFLLNVPASSTVTPSGEWYSLRNTENKLSVIISAASDAAFVNIVFRQKRGTRKR